MGDIHGCALPGAESDGLTRWSGNEHTDESFELGVVPDEDDGAVVRGAGDDLEHLDDIGGGVAEAEDGFDAEFAAESVNDDVGGIDGALEGRCHDERWWLVKFAEGRGEEM